MNDDNEKVLLTIQISPAFKEAIGIKATKADKPVSQFIREVLATYIGYDLRNEPTVKRGRKSATESEKSDRELAKKFLRQLQHEQHIDSVEALEAYLKRRGIDSE
jgi:hypothetical protein